MKLLTMHMLRTQMTGLMLLGNHMVKSVDMLCTEPGIVGHPQHATHMIFLLKCTHITISITIPYAVMVAGVVFS